MGINIHLLVNPPVSTPRAISVHSEGSSVRGDPKGSYSGSFAGKMGNYHKTIFLCTFMIFSA